MRSDSSPSRVPMPAAGPRGGRDASETKERLLDAAAQLFAERGYAGTSMRAVTQAAGVSVSAANYHFGTKEALLLATLGRTILPVNQARMEALDALEARAGAAGPTLEQVLEAFLAPAVRGRDQAPGRDRFREVAARLYSDPPEVVTAFKEENFGPLSARFTAAFQRAVPDRNPREIAVAFQLIVGMMVHVISGQLELGNIGFAAGSALPSDEELLDQMVRFGAAGMRSTVLRAEDT